jgi:uncharacterized repeat protein (TIGR03806 family)
MKNILRSRSAMIPVVAVAIMLVIALAVSCQREDMPPALSYGLDTRPAGECPAPPRPAEAAGIAMERTFLNFTFERPVAMYQLPGSGDEWWVVEQPGRVRAAGETGSVLRTVLDLRPKVFYLGEAGLLDLAFHPEWLSNRQVFVSYNGLNPSGRLTSYLSRFLTAGSPAVIDPATEKVILEVGQPFSNHNGGRIAFGPDGYLYFGLGDGGSGGDPLDQGQDRGTLLGKLLRIDVDRGDPYAIPADNPFAAGGGRAEIFAWGFRNPWRWSFDTASGDLWAGDVGQNSWEEIDLVRLGGNYGWRIREGAHCFNPNPCSSEGLIDPVSEYSHQEGCSVTGGFVYHGAAIPALNGVYLFGDFCSGAIWGIFHDSDGNPLRRLLAASGLNIAAFAQSRAGEMYALDYGGVIARIVPAGAASSPAFPALLSQTGFVRAGAPGQPATCLIPYDVLEPFWSDGAEKERFFYVPASARVGIDGQGHLTFPIGSVLVKNFRLNGRRIETRLLVRHQDGEWAGYTYEWNEAQSDAALLASGKQRPVQNQTWYYPSRAQCLQCHTAAAGRSLGTEIGQLNRTLLYTATGRSANQLLTYEHIGLLADPLPAAVDQLSALPRSGDSGVSLTARAKSYLHVNCANCHRPGGTARGEMDLRFATAWPAMNVCNVAPLLNDLGIADARLVAPGAPGRSLLLQRLRRQDVFRMPPIGGDRPDTAGIQLLENWIQGLAGCN